MNYLSHLQLLLVLLIHIFSNIELSHEISCKNEDNHDVDWYIIYKLPKISDENDGSKLKDGSAYAYVTADDPSGWKLSEISIESPKSMLGLTWKEFDDRKKDNSGYLFYNDEAPAGYTGTTTGHLKGIVAFDSESGFWLSHSIPKFGVPEKYEYPKNGLTYGQTAVCVTYSASSVNNICDHLVYCHPRVYAYDLQDSVRKMLDENAQTLFSDKPVIIRTPPFERKSSLESLHNTNFQLIAKGNRLKEELYSEIIAPSLETSLTSETWRNGAGNKLDPSCEGDYTVTNVEAINMVVSGRKEGIFFKSTEDHSKWTISTETSSPFVCLADLNRVESQEKRGGGAICFESNPVWKTFQSSIEDSSKCNA